MDVLLNICCFILIYQCEHRSGAVYLSYGIPDIYMYVASYYLKSTYCK